MSNRLLHEEAFDHIPVIGERYKKLLVQRVTEVEAATKGLEDPDITVLIRAKNHTKRLEELFEDIAQQEFDGSVQVVAVCTKSEEGGRRTIDIAKAHGATIRTIEQNDFNHARSLNIGFEASDNPYVDELVAHSRLSNELAFRAITAVLAQWPEFAGAYGAALPVIDAKLGDIAISLLQRNEARLAPTEVITKWRGGAMVAHRSVVNKKAWKKLGHYDKRYGNGGEDTDMARRMLKKFKTSKEGWEVIRQPGLSVHHSYGLGIIGSARKSAELYIKRSASPRPFKQGTARHLEQS
jgi:glycosyltransferase involved in cell wall biosynthesis